MCQVDDDQRYGPLLLESLLRGMGPAPGRAIGAATQHAHTHLGGQVLEGAKIGFTKCPKSKKAPHTTIICLCAAAAIGCYWWLFPLLLFVVFFFVSPFVHFAEPNKTTDTDTTISLAEPNKPTVDFGKVCTACCFGESSLMMRSSTSSVFPLTARPPKQEDVGCTRVTALQSQMDSKKFILRYRKWCNEEIYIYITKLFKHI